MRLAGERETSQTEPLGAIGSRLLLAVDLEIGRANGGYSPLLLFEGFRVYDFIIDGLLVYFLFFKKVRR